MKCKLIFLSIITCTLIACSKLNPDATDTTLTEGRWRVESIRYTGVRPDGTSVSGEDNSQAAIFFAGDIHNISRKHPVLHHRSETTHTETSFSSRI